MAIDADREHRILLLRASDGDPASLDSLLERHFLHRALAALTDELARTGFLRDG